MKRILIIDDLRIFDPLPDEEIVTARTIEEGRGWLVGWPWHEVWLDHDLGGDSTIRPLVSFIEECAHSGGILEVGMFVIITDNDPARKWMIAALSPHYPIEVGKREFRVDWDATPA